jgi:hypothetical protein
MTHSLARSVAVLSLAALGCGGPQSTAQVSGIEEPDVEGPGESESTIVRAPAVGYEVTDLGTTAAGPPSLAELVDPAGAVRIEPMGRARFASYGTRLSGIVRSRVARWQRERRAMRASEPEAEEAPAADPASSEAITNTQVAGVDEGGIVKNWGEYLVILRRGRLFTMRVGAQPGSMTPVHAIDVRPPGTTYEAWYDEMLIHAPSGTVIVVGYSYDNSATELGRFTIAADGTLRHRETSYLRSNDYYSSRNYASRLIGDELVLYTPHYLVDVEWPVRPSALALRSGSGAWRPIVDGTQVYVPHGERDLFTLHSVVRCDLSAPQLSCTARGILGPESRSFYVSADAVYVWVMHGVNEWTDDEDAEAPARSDSYLYRLPLDGSAPRAVRVDGAPIDQFSFDERDGMIRVLVTASGDGDAMWHPESATGAMALLELPLDAFGDAIATARAGAYRSLPTRADGHTLQNRYVGDWLLYGAGNSWGQAAPSNGQDRIHLHRVRGGARGTFSIALPHGVDRIESMAPGAVVIGSSGSSLHFTSLALTDRPAAVDQLVRANVGQGETRSHGFFYRSLAEGRGVLGLPVRNAAQPGYAHLVEGSAEVAFLAVDQLRFTALGGLAAQQASTDDHCEVSCVDWYGNARPIFLRDRVFALLGYELVEGRIDAAAMHEIGRESFLTALR